MDQECNKFGVGPKELTGALDLIHHFKLARHHEFFCKKSIPTPVSKAHYLNNVVGATEISQGDGMQLSQLVQNIPCTTEKREIIRVFNLNDLTEAFKFGGHNPLRVQPGLSKIELKDKETNNEKHGDAINEMNQGSKKARKNHKHQSKDTDKDKKVKRSHQDTTTEVRLLEKKRNHDGDENQNGFHRQKRK
ncbi:unnamed protein product [Rhodiola kirilowii]